MDVIYAETINSFAHDLDSLWKDKKKYQPRAANVSGNDRAIENCSLNRFILSASSNCEDIRKLHANNQKHVEIINNAERLAKTASIWTRPHLSRSETDEILQEFEKGIFIVRMTTDKKTMVLSYRSDDKVQHVMIKVDVTKGFFMDGSHNVFRNVNLMIAHYMVHSLQTPSLLLKLPRALREASEPMHFKFFENLKLDFWKTSLANKSISDIWPVSSTAEAKNNQAIESDKGTDSESNPTLPPRSYDLNDLNIIQGLAEAIEPDEDVYNKIQKKEKERSLPSPIIQPQVDKPMIERIYSGIWNWKSEPKLDVEKSIGKSRKPSDEESSLIKNIIEYYYPQIVKENYQCPKGKIVIPSLTDDIAKMKKLTIKEEVTSTIGERASVVYESQYETPWDIQTPWITKLMNMDSYDSEKQSKLMSEMVKASSLEMKSNSAKEILHNQKADKGYDKTDLKTSDNLSVLRINSFSDDEDDFDTDLWSGEDKLKKELLAEIQPVMYTSASTYSVHSQKNSPFGQSIRKYLIQLCSRRGTSDISNSVRMFIQCTIERTDLSPYTTMRLIRQYMSGLKNLIKQQKSEFSLMNVIEEERKQTPKNVFINLDSIMESVLTKVVMKPLTSYIYRLLILEHYKNNSLKLISEGVEVAKHIEPAKLGLQKSSIKIINSKIQIIQQKFILMAKTYSPEKKIGHLISIIEIVFQMVKLIYPEVYSDSQRTDVKSDKLLSILVFIFSQCKKDAIAAQCEVEYIEGMIWSPSLVNGEPGFYLMNLMSSLEAIKVLARPEISPKNAKDLKNNEPLVVSNSSFFAKISPSTVASAAIFSVNVIILDEKVNRLVTKTFPVRSTVNARNLCNSIAHRLGIFNPMEYSLFKFTGVEEILLDDFEFPLQVKQKHQQTTGETINFLFKRKNATFILPPIITTQ